MIVKSMRNVLKSQFGRRKMHRARCEAEDYNFRSLQREDIPEIMEIRRRLGSHDCRSCLQTWLQLHPGGIFIAQDRTGNIVGTGGFVHNSDGIATGGIVYVDPKMRNAGIGKEILQLGLELSNDRIICGNSVESMTKVYHDIFGALPRRNFTIIKNATTKNPNFQLLSEKVPKGITLQPFTDNLQQCVNEYDFKLMGYDRSKLLELNCHEEDSLTFVALKGVKCVGFGSVKLSCLGAARVGPLYSDDPAVAEALLRSLLKSFPHGKGFVMMTLSNNFMANSLMVKMAVPTQQHLVQVFRKQFLEVDSNKVYGHFDVNFNVF